VLWLGLPALCLLLLALAPAQAVPFPGPDAFGYRGESSAGGKFPHQWNSIAGAPGATQLFLTDDSAAGPIPIGFTFRHYDGLFTDAYLSSNGYIALSANGATTISGTLPSTGTPQGVIAGAWTDWNPGCNTGTLHYGTFGAAPNRFFVYQFTDIDRFSYCGGTPEGTFQIILHEAGWVEMQYLSIALPIGSVTIGIENLAGTDGLTYLNGAGATTLTAFGLRYYTNAPPRLQADTAVAIEDQGTVSIEVLANDSDPEGDPLDIVSTPGETFRFNSTNERKDLRTTCSACGGSRCASPAPRSSSREPSTSARSHPRPAPRPLPAAPRPVERRHRDHRPRRIPLRHPRVRRVHTHQRTLLLLRRLPWTPRPPNGTVVAWTGTYHVEMVASK
jgi:hypothetical protein